ncbi:MAG TPA: PilZ domain-containing protein, partial [Candidatus Methylomirabilis sp.]
VNISGEAVRFIPDAPMAVGDQIDLRMVLPPFIPLEVRGEVTQTRSVSSLPEAIHAVVVRFMNMRDMDREKIIRYVVQRQADLFRRRERDRHDPNFPGSP